MYIKEDYKIIINFIYRCFQNRENNYLHCFARFLSSWVVRKVCVYVYMGWVLRLTVYIEVFDWVRLEWFLLLHLLLEGLKQAWWSFNLDSRDLILRRRRQGLRRQRPMFSCRRPKFSGQRARLRRRRRSRWSCSRARKNQRRARKSCRRTRISRHWSKCSRRRATKSRGGSRKIPPKKSSLSQTKVRFQSHRSNPSAKPISGFFKRRDIELCLEGSICRVNG